MLRRVALVLMTIAIIALIFMIASKPAKENSAIVTFPENRLVIENLYAIHVMRGKEGFATLTADVAYVDAETDRIALENTYLELKDNGTTFTSYADRGIYIINTSLAAMGNIEGKWNEMDYSVAPEGTFYYDFNSETATAGDNVTFTTEESYMKAKRVDYTGGNGYLDFTGNFEMLIGEDLLREDLL